MLHFDHMQILYRFPLTPCKLSLSTYFATIPRRNCRDLGAVSPRPDLQGYAEQACARLFVFF
jgi:hypothetical protein